MFSSTLLPVVAPLIGAATGFLAAKIAPARTKAQYLYYEPKVEEALIRQLVEHNNPKPYINKLSSDAVVSPKYREILQDLGDLPTFGDTALEPAEGSDNPTEEAATTRTVLGVEPQNTELPTTLDSPPVPEEIDVSEDGLGLEDHPIVVGRSHVVAVSLTVGLLLLLGLIGFGFLYLGVGVATVATVLGFVVPLKNEPDPDSFEHDIEAAVDALNMVASARNVYGGACPPTETGNETSPLQRHVNYSRGRVALGVLVGTLFMGFAGFVVGDGWFGWVSVLVLAALTGIGLTLAFVDHDTLLVDMPLLMFVGLPLVVAGIAGVVADQTIEVMFSVLVALGVAGFLWVAGKLGELVLGVETVGAGDPIVIAFCAPIPAIVFNDPMISVLVLFAAAMTASLWRVPLVLMGRVARNTPFAFVPYLVLGWPLAALVSVSGILGNVAGGL